MKTIITNESTARLISLLVFNELQMLEDRIKIIGMKANEIVEIGMEINDLKIFLKQLQARQ